MPNTRPAWLHVLQLRGRLAACYFATIQLQMFHTTASSYPSSAHTHTFSVVHSSRQLAERLPQDGACSSLEMAVSMRCSAAAGVASPRCVGSIAASTSPTSA